jgi:hypothetical protein
MQKTILILLFTSVLGAQYNPPSGSGSAGSPVLTYFVSTLPGSATVNTVAQVTDGTSGTDCTVGGGAARHFCSWTGSAWVVSGSGGTAALPSAASAGYVLTSTGPGTTYEARNPSTWPNGYTYYAPIVIDHTQVGAINNTDQTNFPVTVCDSSGNLATVANGGFAKNSSGFDIIFTSDLAGSTKLTWEVQSYSATTGVLCASVTFPTLSHTVDTTFYKFVGNSAVSTFQGGAVGAAYDGTFLGVWHFEEASGSASVDSTAHGNDLIQVNAPSQSPGLIGGSLSYNGTNQYTHRGSALATLSVPVSLTYWVKGTTLSGILFSMMETVGLWNGYYCGIASNSIGAATVFNSFALQGAATVTRTLNDGAWHQIVAIWTNASIRTVYVDGGTHTNTDTTTVVPAVNPTEFVFGAAAHDNTIDNFAIASVDEVSFANVSRSADWVDTDYNNKKAGSTFLSAGVLTATTPITTGLTAPVSSCPPGALYTRTDSTGGLYVCLAGTWGLLSGGGGGGGTTTVVGTPPIPQLACGIPQNTGGGAGTWTVTSSLTISSVTNVFLDGLLKTPTTDYTLSGVLITPVSPSAWATHNVCADYYGN